MGLDVFIFIVRDGYGTNSVTGRFAAVSTNTGDFMLGRTLEDSRGGTNNRANPIPDGAYNAFTHTDGGRGFRVELSDVPGFTHIQIHRGNSDKDVEGFFVLGKSLVNDDFVGQSTVAMGRLENVINSDGGNIIVGVQNGPTIGDNFPLNVIPGGRDLGERLLPRNPGDSQ